MEIDRNSLSFRLYSYYGNGYTNAITAGTMNFCQYSKKVLLGCLAVFGWIALGVFIGIGWVQSIGSLLHWLFSDLPFMWFLNPEGDGIGVIPGIMSLVSLLLQLVILALAAGATSFDFIGSWWGERKIDPETGMKRKSQPGFIRTWFRSWKDKYCPIVTLKDETPDEASYPTPRPRPKAKPRPKSDDPLDPKWPRS